MIMEIWKDVVGYEGLYQVSSIGRIKSLERTDCIKHTRPERIMKTQCTNGTTAWYPKVMLVKNKIKRTHNVHRLEMIAFYGLSKLIINHIDGDKTNNKLENLEYCTHGNNQRHAYRTKLKSAANEKNGRSKLTNSQVVQIRKELIPYYAGIEKALSKKYKVCETIINRIKNRRIWKTI